MLDAILGTLTGQIGLALGAILTVAGAFLWGKREGTTGERERRAGQDARDYRDTRRRMDHAAGGTSDDDGALRDWLRKRGSKER